MNNEIVAEDITYKDKIIKNIEHFREIIGDEPEPDDLPLQQESVDNYISLMIRLKPVRMPGLGVSQTGNIITAWTTDKDRLTIEFLSNNWARWSVCIHPELDNGDWYLSGRVPMYGLIDSLSLHNLCHWWY